MTLARTHSAEDTQALAGEVAGLARPGDVILLTGELGAGKTVFAKGFGRALGVDETITSPSFTLVRNYDARVPLVHADLYRVDHLQEAIDAGMPELLDEGAVSLVEWGERVAPALPGDFLEVQMELGVDEGERRVRLAPVGPGWLARWDALCRVIAPWTGEG